MVPVRCAHYHLRFKLTNSTADLWIDDAKIIKLINQNSTLAERQSVLPPTEDVQGFLRNPAFKLDHSHWKYSGDNVTGTLVQDEDLGRSAMSLRAGQALRQDIKAQATPGQDYQFSFFAKVTLSGYTRPYLYSGS